LSPPSLPLTGGYTDAVPDTGSFGFLPNKEKDTPIMEWEFEWIDRAERRGELRPATAAKCRAMARAGEPWWDVPPDDPTIGQRIREQARAERDAELEREVESGRLEKVGPGHYVHLDVPDVPPSVDRVHAQRTAPRRGAMERRAGRAASTRRRARSKSGTAARSGTDDSGGDEPPDPPGFRADSERVEPDPLAALTADVGRYSIVANNKVAILEDRIAAVELAVAEVEDRTAEALLAIREQVAP